MVNVQPLPVPSGVDILSGLHAELDGTVEQLEKDLAIGKEITDKINEIYGGDEDV